MAAKEHRFDALRLLKAQSLSKGKGRKKGDEAVVGQTMGGSGCLACEIGRG